MGFQLHRNLCKQASTKSSRSDGLPQASTSVCSTTSGESGVGTSAQVVEKEFQENEIPNLFHTLDCDQTFDELIDWMATSKEVRNLLMFIEGIWTWMLKNWNHPVIDCSTTLMDRIGNVRRKRGWNVVPYKYLNGMRSGNNWVYFVAAVRSRPDICSIAADSEEFWVDVYCKGKHSFESFLKFNKFLTPRLQYLHCSQFPHSSHPGLEPCTRRGRMQASCGFIIKACINDEETSLRLNTDPTNNGGLHFHEEFEAKRMHLVIRDDAGKCFPISWFGRPSISNNTCTWKNYPVQKRHQFWFVVLI